MEKRDQGLSNIRAVSCIAIVILHTFYTCFGSFAPKGFLYTSSVIARNLMYWAVPCFIMVTGALLLDPARDVTYKKIFRKYIPRMVAALVIFSVIFKAYDIYFGFSKFTLKTLPDLGWSLLTGQGLWSHMWYLYTLIALYLIVPILRPFVRQTDKKTQQGAIVVLVLFLSIVPAVTTLTGIETGFYIPVYTIYPLYLLLGGLLGKSDRKIGSRRGLMAVAVFAIGMSYLTWYSLLKNAAALKELINTYSFILTVIGAWGMFVLIRKYNKKNRVLEVIDQNSFGIYLIHLMPLKYLAMKQPFNPYFAGIGSVLLVAAGAFAISFGVTWLLRKIPFVEKLL